jgi:hypothetical protein
MEFATLFVVLVMIWYQEGKNEGTEMLRVVFHGQDR